MKNRGFSTLEIIMALAIIVITLSAVVITSFGSQSLLVAGQTDAEAMNEAQSMLEQEQAFARKDFNLVNSTSSISGIYTDTITVVQKPDLLTKEVDVVVSWKDQRNQTRSLSLTTLVTNFNNAIGGDTCSSVLTGNWSTAHVAFQKTLDAYLSTTTAYTISDVDAYKGMLYVTAAKTPYANAPSLFIFDISSPNNPVFKGSVDNAPSTSVGLNALHIAENLATSPAKRYAFVANAYGANFGTCGLSSPSCAQFQVIDVTDPVAASVAANLKMNYVTSSTGGAGNSLFYQNGYVFLGLTSTNSAGPEFHVIAVQSPTIPIEVGSWPNTPSVTMGSDINAIGVSDGYAYLAHPTSAAYNERVTALSVSSPSSPVRKGGFLGSGGLGNGKSIFTVGDTAYLGRTATNLSGAADSVPEWYALTSSKGVISATPAASFPLTTSGDSVDGVFTRDYLSFLVTNSKFIVLNATSSTQVTSIALPGSGSATEPSIDCENNTFYVASNDASDKGTISVITP